MSIVLWDLWFVIVFCLIGRMSHDEGIFGDVLGTLNTIWPFAVAVIAAHLLLRWRRARTERLLPGLVIWAITVAGGLGLRALAGQGTALPFVFVATATLALFLLGWRALLALRRRLQRRARTRS